MTIVSDVEIRLRADIARLRSDLGEARAAVTGAVGSMSQTVERFKSLLGGLAVGAVFKELAGQVIGAQREFDKLNSALITATGSSDKAAKAFSALQNFAATTPFDLKQTVDAFLKLRNMGLDPSERALRSYGNTAGALGKSLNQMIEAVADAATGEFERLKEFGIKASQNGESVRLTFQGVSTSVANNAKAIQAYLLKLGETRFAGGMELQAKTLDGAISNLGDSWQALLRTISQSGFGDAANTGVRKLTSALESLAAQIKDGGPVIEGLKLAAKLTAAYVATMAAPALLAAFASALSAIGLNLSLIKLELRAGMGMWGLFNTSLTGTSVAAGLAAGSLTKLQVAASLLFAAFAGWEIGKYLNDNFYQARVAGETFVGAMLTGWENIKYGAEVLWLAVKTGWNSVIGGVKEGFAGFVDANATVLDKIGASAKAATLKAYAQDLRDSAAAGMDFGRALSLLDAGHEKTIELINKETDARVAAAVVQGQISEADRQQMGDALKGIDVKAEATKEALDWYKKTMEASKDAYDQQVLELQGGRELTAEEKKRVEVLNDLARVGKTLSGTQKQAITDYQNATVNLARYNDQQKRELELRSQLIADARQQVQAAEQQSVSLEDQIKFYGLTEDAVLRLKAAELDRQLAAAEADSIEAGRLAGLLDETNRQIVAQTKLTKMKADTSFWTSMEDAAHTMFMSIQNGNRDMWQRMKDAAKNMFFEWLYQMTVKKWIIQIGTAFSGTAGVSGIANAATSGAGGLSGITSMADLGTKIYTGITNGFASVGATLGGMVTGVGNILGSSSISAYGAGMGMTSAQAAEAAAAYNGAGMAGTGTAITSGSAMGAAAGIFAGAAGGYLGGNLISGQYGSKGTVAAGTAIGAAIGSIVPVIGTAFGALIGGLLGGVANRLFGMGEKKVTSTIIEGALTPTGATGSTVNQWTQPGGWFRSDKSGTESTALNATQTDAFAATYKAILGVSKVLGDTIGADTTMLATRAQALHIDLTGLADDTARMAAVTKFFTDVGDTIAVELVPNLKDFQKEGESLSATMQRVVIDYANVKDGLAAIGAKLGAVGAAGITASQNLITAAGGMSALASGLSYFQENFYTDAQKLEKAQTQVAAAMSSIGFASVKTNEQFKAATLGIDLTTQAGADLFAKMLALAPVFKTVTDAADAAAKAAADLAAQQAAQAASAAQAAAAAKAQALADNETLLRGQVSGALDQLKTAIDARKEAIKSSFDEMMAGLSASVDKWSTKITDLKSLSSLLTGAKVGAGQNSASRESAQAQLEAAFAIAKSSGVLPSADSIKDAVSAVTADSSNQFATLIEYQRDQARASTSIAGLAGLTDDQLSTAEKTLQVLMDQRTAAQTAYDRQLGALDALVTSADKAAQIALGTYQATLSVDAGIATVAAAIAALKLGATTSNPTGAGMSVADLYTQVLGRAPDAGGLAFWQKAFGDMVDSSEYAQFIAGAAPELAAKASGTWAQWLAAHGAAGTIPTGQSNGMQTALDTFNAQVSGMQAALDRTAKSTQQLADQFNAVSAGGNALLTESA